MPAWKNYESPTLPFSWRKAFRREFYGISCVTTGCFVLDVIQDFAVTGRITFDPVWTAMFCLGAFFFLTMRTLKKRMSLFRPEEERSSERA